MLIEKDKKLAEDLVEAIRFFNQKGWSPATSTNYSVRSTQTDRFVISRSGVDKSKFRLEDLILIDEKGEIVPPFNQPGIKSSAETEIHTALYHRFPDANCVLHTHSVLGTALSLAHLKNNLLRFENFEILKGLEGNDTHSLSEELPIVPNSQKMTDILSSMENHFAKRPHGFLIAGHGLYTWGRNLADAKRHVETYEFLFECIDVMRRH